MRARSSFLDHLLFGRFRRGAKLAGSRIRQFLPWPNKATRFEPSGKSKHPTAKNRCRRQKHRPPTVELWDVRQLESLELNEGTDVVVIMPCVDEHLGMDTARLLAKRAGMECKIIAVDDTLHQGFIKTLNQAAARISPRYIVYVAQDAYPGRDWLRKAYDTMERTRCGLLGFNDGKWYGRIAAFGMVRMGWVGGLYGGPVFFPGYKSHAADNELTVIARATDMYVYDPNCVLVEYDPDKEAKNHNRNKQDGELFKKRFIDAFDGLAPARSLRSMAKAYGVGLPTVTN